jgi:hypothetical protein
VRIPLTLCILKELKDSEGIEREFINTEIGLYKENKLFWFM